jgi:murein DD-endopeptidase MepM/ murein hydrolase activator NlpD
MRLLPRATALAVAVLALHATVARADSGGAAPGVSGAGTTHVSGGAAPGVVAASTPAAPPRRRTKQPAVKAKPKSSAPAVVDAKPLSAGAIARAGGASPTSAAVVKPTPTPSTPPATVPTVAGLFPVLGPYSFGGADARFGAKRSGHIHQGQDVIAAEGTPLITPVSGTVIAKANQKAGAGLYLVIHGNDTRDYVFMHLRPHTIVVALGVLLSAGQRIAAVGHTGDASGPHLHFEIWVGGWQAKHGRPIDPLPQLKRWAR